MVIVLGIDPGPIETAYVIWDGSKILAKGKINSALIIDAETKFCPFPDLVACEMITGYGKNVGQEVFETCRWEGKFELYFECANVPFRRVSRRDVKMWICENHTAKDSDVLAALTDKIGQKGNKKAPGPTFGMVGDMWAALAVGVYAFDAAKGNKQ